MRDTVRVATVEDQQGIREGLRFFIDNAPGFRCTGCFGSVEEALPSLTAGSVDIVLMDLGLPGMSGIEGIRIIKERHPSLKLVALTVYEDDDRNLRGAVRRRLGLSSEEDATATIVRMPAGGRKRRGADVAQKSRAASSRSSANFALPRSLTITSRHTSCDSWPPD